MKSRLETINVSLLIDENQRPYGDVVIFREGRYYRRYVFHPGLRGGISAASMRRCQQVQAKLMAEQP